MNTLTGMILSVSVFQVLAFLLGIAVAPLLGESTEESGIVATFVTIAICGTMLTFCGWHPQNYATNTHWARAIILVILFAGFSCIEATVFSALFPEFVLAASLLFWLVYEILVFTVITYVLALRLRISRSLD